MESVTTLLSWIIISFRITDCIPLLSKPIKIEVLKLIENKSPQCNVYGMKFTAFILFGGFWLIIVALCFIIYLILMFHFILKVKRKKKKKSNSSTKDQRKNFLHPFKKRMKCHQSYYAGIFIPKINSKSYKKLNSNMSNKTGDKTIEDNEKPKGGGLCCCCKKKKNDDLSGLGSYEATIKQEEAQIYQSRPMIQNQAYYYNPPPATTSQRQNQYVERQLSPRRDYEMTRQKSVPSTTYTVRATEMQQTDSPAYTERMSTTKYAVNIQQSVPMETNPMYQERPPPKPLTKAPIPQVCRPPPPPSYPPCPHVPPSPHVHPTINVPANQFASSTPRPLPPPSFQPPPQPLPPPPHPSAQSSHQVHRSSPSHAPSPGYAQSPVYTPAPVARPQPDSRCASPASPRPQPSAPVSRELQSNYRSSQQAIRPISPDVQNIVYKQPPQSPPQPPPQSPPRPPPQMQPVYEKRPPSNPPPCPLPIQEVQQPMYRNAPPLQSQSVQNVQKTKSKERSTKAASDKSGKPSTSAPVQSYGGSTSAVTEDEKSQAKKGCCASKNKTKGIGAIHPIINEYKVDGHLNVKGKVNQATISIPTDSYLVTK